MTTVDALFGADKYVAWWQMVIRGIVVLFYALTLFRVAGRRIFTHSSTLDMILSVIIGSSLSRVITGSAEMGPTFAAAASMVAVYWVLLLLGVHFKTIRWLTKANPIRLITDGKFDRAQMHRMGLTESDLMEAMRMHGLGKPEQVATAEMEATGAITVIKNEARS